MKKIVMLFCLLMMLAGTAMAADYATVNMDVAGTPEFDWERYIEGDQKIRIYATVPYGATVHVTVYRDSNLAWDDEDRWVYSNEQVVNGTQYESKEFSLEYTQSKTESYRVELRVNGELVKYDYLYRKLSKMRNNTFCTRGIRFRDYDPTITDKWFMFTPVELRKINDDYGTKTIDLIGSNMYLIGKLAIIRRGNQVRFEIVDIDTWNDARGKERSTYGEEAGFYTYDHDIDFGEVHIELYNSIADVGSVEYKDVGSYQLNTWYTLQDPQVLLYVCGMVSYDPNGLERAGDSYGSSHVENLVQLMESFE